MNTSQPDYRNSERKKGEHDRDGNSWADGNFPRPDGERCGKSGSNGPLPCFLGKAEGKKDRLISCPYSFSPNTEEGGERHEDYVVRPCGFLARNRGS